MASEQFSGLKTPYFTLKNTFKIAKMSIFCPCAEKRRPDSESGGQVYMKNTPLVPGGWRARLGDKRTPCVWASVSYKKFLIKKLECITSSTSIALRVLHIANWPLSSADLKEKFSGFGSILDLDLKKNPSNSGANSASGKTPKYLLLLRTNLRSLLSNFRLSSSKSLSLLKDLLPFRTNFRLLLSNF